jgi:hypothetical protein
MLTMLTACEYNFIEPTPPPPAPPANDSISYSEDIQPIWDAKCVSCHPAVYKPDLTAANSYTALKSGNYVVDSIPSASSLYTKIYTGGSMASYVSADQVSLIYRWIYAGAKND